MERLQSRGGRRAEPSTREKELLTSEAKPLSKMGEQDFSARHFHCFTKWVDWPRTSSVPASSARTPCSNTSTGSWAQGGAYRRGDHGSWNGDDRCSTSAPELGPTGQFLDENMRKMMNMACYGHGEGAAQARSA